MTVEPLSAVYLTVSAGQFSLSRFRQVSMNDARVHHDALEFPDGQIVKVTRLVAGQTTTVLQLPASLRHQDRKSAPQPSAEIAGRSAAGTILHHWSE
jgi:hypothetical protein